MPCNHLRRIDTTVPLMGAAAFASGAESRIEQRHGGWMGEEKQPQRWEVLGEEHEGDFEIFRARALRARSPSGTGGTEKRPTGSQSRVCRNR
jgi:hypothetical protein